MEDSICRICWLFLMIVVGVSIQTVIKAKSSPPHEKSTHSVPSLTQDIPNTIAERYSN